MKTFTLDWNCLIAVENLEPEGTSVSELIDLHRNDLVDVAITTVSASESLAGSRTFPASAAAFNERISNVGWDDISIELGPAVIGLSYIGMCKIVSDSFTNEVDAIWNVLFPNIPKKVTEVPGEELWSKDYSKWRNVWCDVHTVWTHISCGRDVFLTVNTRDFQRNLHGLRKLGLREVLLPSEAVGMYR